MNRNRSSVQSLFSLTKGSKLISNLRIFLLQSLWVERTTLILVQSLPGISRWFEVEKREVVSMK